MRKTVQQLEEYIATEEEVAEAAALLSILCTCPGCGAGGSAIEVQRTHRGEKRAIQCDNCGWQGPSRSTAKRAAEAWDTRAT